jgi:diaminopimelate epimerase
VATLGPEFQRHRSFPQSVNVGFMQVVDDRAIRLRVYERGAGETLACGTGACAAVVAGIRAGLLDREVTVTTRGGDLAIRWPAPGDTKNAAPVMMTGDAVRVFDGEIGI